MNADLVILLGEAKAVDERRLLLLGLPEEHEAADRVGVLDQLVPVEGEVVEPLPPLGLGLAPVVVEKLREQPARIALLRAFEQRGLQLLALAGCGSGLVGWLAALGRGAPRCSVRPQPEQPPVQLVGGAAVLLVVALDVVEDGVVAAFHPFLEAHDRLVSAGDLGGSLEAVDLLDRLDRVAVDRRAQRLLDDAVEVDEHLLAQEVVHLLLAGAVLAHQPRQRRALVGGVVVDVQAGAPPPALDDPVDEALERRPLAVPVPPPQRVVDDLTGVVPVAVAEQVLEPARGLVEGVALHVEPDVSLVRLGQQPKAAVLLGGQKVDEVPVLPPPPQLQRGLVADRLERLGAEPLDRRAGLEPAERLEGADARLGERLGLPAAHAGDEGEMVVVDALLPADLTEVADAAVVARPPVRLRPALEGGEETPADATVVGLEVGDAEGLALAAAVFDMDVLDGASLDARDLLGVEHELEHVCGLGAARELGVDGLVRAVGPLFEEVCEPAPTALGE